MGEASEPAELLNKSVLKAVRLLRELAIQQKSGATASTLAKAVGLSRPTAFRLLTSLERVGMVDRIGNHYVLGWELARLGQKADPYAGLVARVQPYLQELADEFNESITLSAVNSADRLDLVAEAQGSHVVGATSSSLARMVGQQYPLHASSSGKVLLSELPIERVNELLPAELEAFTPHTITDRDVLFRELEHVREQGYAVIDNELEEGLIALSCPIRDSGGALVAVINLNAPRYRFGRDRIPQAVSRLRAAADQMTSALWTTDAED
ncbi:IclR family transcriptional regulator [Saccharopolyspora subtropica]|uniref:IclR family transcriptional regulator n=1 Tax=Saccharopolyspora thermophila TaxID=89367 RepID=A0A917JQF2_9PSEU|nr:IclR family transcriptional regulator [Saccharopolyspora subtropica]GGI76702.1 IclR family transcriptional regulator [Saccharopolyspora subtropica]